MKKWIYSMQAKRDGNYSDLNIVFMKLRTHMDALFSVDLPLHILIMYRMRKYVCYLLTFL